MAHCPKCRGRRLAPTLLAEGLSAKGCEACGGALVDLVSYRAWAERAGVAASEAAASGTAEIDDTSQAIACPNCKSVMTKFRLAAAADNRLDYCGHCDAVWLDGGEWEQLDDLGLRASLGSVFTEPWQRRVRKEIDAQSHMAVLKRRFGEDFERLAEIRAWLQEHPQFEYILPWLADRGDS